MWGGWGGLGWAGALGFQVQGNDVHLPNLLEGTKSRPSSPMFGCRGSNNDDQEDPELAEALKQSMQGVTVAGNELYCAQETGITGSGGTHNTSPVVNPNFIPAQENKEYNPSEWALTVTAPPPATQEPLPAERKRPPDGAPAFLRPSFSSYYLGGALSILHTIPRARDSFLVRSVLLPDYGRNSKWWSGEKIGFSRAVDLDGPSFSVPDAEEIIHELQRLMAFLGGTNRAYGSVDVLAELPKIRDQEQTGLAPPLPTSPSSTLLL